MDSALKFVPPGGYRACSNCATAKAKCIKPDEGSGKCERCQKLDKDCQVLPRSKKRRRQADGSAKSPQTAGTPGSSVQSREEPLTTQDVIQRLGISDEQAEELLRLWREYFNTHHPALTISPQTTAVSLRSEKPILFLAIVYAASYHDLELQTRITRVSLAHIAEQTFQHGRKSLQLLQGVMVFISWYQSQLFQNPQLANLLHQAMALTADLGLEKLDVPNIMRSPHHAYASNSVHGGGVSADGQSLDGRRALAECYLLSSCMSTNFNIVNPLQYSTQLEDTCKRFESSDVSSNDFRLAKMVRLQYIISRVYQAQRDLAFGSMQTIPILQIKSFQENLNHIWRNVPSEVKNDVGLRLLYHTAEIHIYKMSLVGPTDNLADSQLTPAATPTPFPAEPSSLLEHEELQFSCLLAIKAWYDVFFALPLSSYFQIPFTILLQLAHTDVTYARLTALWAATQPSRPPPEFASFFDVVDQLTHNFSEAKRSAHPLGWTLRNDAFDVWASRIKDLKSLEFLTPRPPSPAATPVKQGQEFVQMGQEWVTWVDGFSTQWLIGDNVDLAPQVFEGWSAWDTTGL